MEVDKKQKKKNKSLDGSGKSSNDAVAVDFMIKPESTTPKLDTSK